MSRSSILNSSGAPMALSVASNPEPTVAIVPDTGPKFEAPDKPDVLTLQTAHGHMASVMREVVKIDDAGFTDLFDKGVILDPEARLTTEAMRDALALYDDVAARAAGLPVTTFLHQVIARITSALDVPADEDPAVGGALLREALALIKPAILALDYQAQPDVVEAYFVLNGNRAEGVVFVPSADDLDPSHPLYTSPEQDAHVASTGDKAGGVYSSLADAFFDLYGEDDSRPIIRVLIPRPPQ